MNETVSVDEAIARGHRTVNYPIIGIITGVPTLLIVLRTQKLVPPWTVPVSFVVALVLAWLWWSVMVTKWRIWAFENVRNVHELKRRAIREKLIWPDDSLFVNTELRSRANRQKLASLQKKFEQEDVFHDDPNAPKETIIYYARGKNFAEMVLMLGVMGFGIFLLATTGSYVVGTLTSLAGAYAVFHEYRQATNTKPQIILNDKGIQTVFTEFYSWQDIENEEVIIERTRKHTHRYLVYDHPGGSTRIRIDDYDTNEKSLNKLLILYRGRSKKSATIS